MVDLNPANWTWAQSKAAGRNVASYAAGGVTVALAWGLVSQTDAATLTEAIGHIVDGTTELAKGVGMIAGVVVPIYTAWRAAHSSSPKEQIKSVVENLSDTQAAQAANAIADPTGRNKLINAVATMPEVKQVVATTEVAQNTPSSKVVTAQNAPRV